jgi:hypothetical protein
MPADKEIRAYVDPSVGNVTVGIMAVYPIVGTLVSLSNGRFLEVLWLLKRIPVILKHSLRERNSWRIRLGLVVG